MWRYERREKKLESKHKRMKKSGKSMGQIYENVVRKENDTEGKTYSN